MHLQEDILSGQPVIDLTVEVSVPIMLANKSTLRSHASYVLAGGLGGLGRAMAQWMVDQGACNLVFLGRSGARSLEAMDLIQRLQNRGLRVYAPPCDVMDASAVQRVMAEVSRTMPPVRGCIQGSMVLRDQLFDDMGYENWRVAAECKALGSKNLAENLPELDFFVFLSSLSGVHGFQGQSNYAAGNTFMDCLARNFVEHGQKAISFDLGVMIDDGLLSEMTDVLDQVMKTSAFVPVTRSDFFALLSIYCNSNRAISTPDCAQLVCGLPDYSNGVHGNDNTIEQPIFSRLKLNALLHKTSQGRQKSKPSNLFLKTRSLLEGQDVVSQAFFDKMVHSYRLITEDATIDEDATLHTYRIDSLLAVDLCNWIAKEFMADLSVIEIMGGATFAMVSMLVASRSKLAHPLWA